MYNSANVNFAPSLSDHRRSRQLSFCFCTGIACWCCVLIQMADSERLLRSCVGSRQERGLVAVEDGVFEDLTEHAMLTLARYFRSVVNGFV